MFGTHRQWRAALAAPALVALLVAALLVPSPRAAAQSGTTVAVAMTPDDRGYYVVTESGNVTAVGVAHRGDRNGRSAAPIVDLAASTGGYRLVDADGGVTAHGSASHHGDLSGLALNAPIVAIVPTADDNGYWLAAADGGVFAFGNARFYGSMGGTPLQLPVVDAARTPNGRGYWLIAADGGVFSFGNAPFLGSMGGTPLQSPVNGVTVNPTGYGYLLVAGDGGTFAFGEMRFTGSLARDGRRDIVDAASNRAGTGYLLLRTDGTIVDLTPGATAPTTTAPPTTVPPAIAELSQIEADLLRRINAERRNRGVPDLAADSRLRAEAAEWVTTLQNEFAHSNLQATLARLNGRFNQLGENLYWGGGSYADSGSAHVSLMESRSHRNTLLNSAYTSVGLATMCVGRRLYVVQLFGRVSSAGDGWLASGQPAQPIAASGTGGPSCLD